MKTITKVSLIGHLANDPELRQTKKGNTVASFSVATDRFSLDEKGEKNSITDFHNIVAWRGLADVCKKYLVKGSAVYLDGNLVNSSFEDKEGKMHYKTEIVAKDLSILTWKKAENDNKTIQVKPLAEKKVAAKA